MHPSDKIGVCSRSFSRNKFLRDELQKYFSNVKYNDAGLALNGECLIDFLSDCTGAIVALEYIDEDTLRRLPNLKYIGKYGVGLDKIDFNALDKFGVKLGWTPGVNATSVAELTLNMAITIVRNVNKSHQLASRLEWKQVTGKQLSSLTFGILGYGHVGSTVGSLAKAFGSVVIAHDKVDKSVDCSLSGVDFVSFDELLRRSDILSIHVPGNDETRHMISQPQLHEMRRGSYIINTARGGIINEVDLLKTLVSGQIAAAALDVLEVEPPVDDALIAHENVYVTSHVGGSSEEAIMAMGLAAINGLLDHTTASEFAIYK